MRIAIIFGIGELSAPGASTPRHALREAGFAPAGACRRPRPDAGQDCCASAQEIHASLRAGGRSVGIASVYRVLEVLSELRLVQRVDVGDGIARFERRFHRRRPSPPRGLRGLRQGRAVLRSVARARDRERLRPARLQRRRARGRVARRMRRLYVSRTSRRRSRRSSRPARWLLRATTPRRRAARAAAWHRTDRRPGSGGASSSSTTRSARPATRAGARRANSARAQTSSPSRTSFASAAARIANVCDCEVQALRAGRRHDVRGVSGEEQPPVAASARRRSCASRDALLEDRAFVAASSRRARVAALELLPDPLVGPLVEVLVRRALEVEPRDLRRAHAVKREAALVRRRRSAPRSRAAPRRGCRASRTGTRARKTFENAVGDAVAADAVEAVAPGDDVSQLERPPCSRACSGRLGRSDSSSCTETSSTSKSDRPAASRARAAIRSLDDSVLAVDRDRDGP